MKINFKKIIFNIICLISVFFAGCTNETSADLEREEKFTLAYGSFEDELNLFNLNSSYTRPDTQIFMKDGLFYIANSGGQKILKLSSFGDLLTFFYNPETNTPPLFLENEAKNEEKVEEKTEKDGETNSDTEQVSIAAATRLAVKYPFNRPGLLSVTNSKQLFVADSVDDEKIEYDHEENLALREIILRFDEEGNFTDYIGQEGAGGTPFPSIEGVHTNANNELIVVCRTQTSLKIYWYDVTGALLYKIPIFFDALPGPYSESENIFSSVDKIIPDFNELRLYVKIDYYGEEKDSATQASLGVKYDKSCLYFLNLKTGKYERKVDLNFYEDTESDNGEIRKFKKVYELAGVTENGWCYLSTPTESGYAFELIDLKSQKRFKKNLMIENSEMMYNAFHISSKGIISALLASEDKAVIAWWRADKIIGSAN
ncbi:LIC_12708 family protein [Treponema pedis]|uniref:LIC_12708 family protein n=1 Tax=Treponema pedis TaxID=409322 RepID=UPI00197F7BA8|nr:hypothetical protein [Treponema pedis]QSI04477.1 hypothetical protein DYQ05_05775 [Treponema pedis]